MLRDESAAVLAVKRRTFPDSKIIAAIPAYNEGPTIGSVVLKARQFARSVVVIDDGFTDDTAMAWRIPNIVFPSQKTSRRAPGHV